MERALDAMEQSEALETCGCRDCKRVQLNAALPILREAIRAELVQEQIADAAKARSTVETPGVTYLEADEVPLTDWLHIYLPAAKDPQP